MKKIIAGLCIAGASALVAGCYNDSEERLYGKQDCDLSNVSYTNQVLPIIENNCYQCHSANNSPGNGANIVLEGYQNLRTIANSGLLLESITHGSGASPMPKNAQKLSDCDINTIKTWIENGTPNN